MNRCTKPIRKTPPLILIASVILLAACSHARRDREAEPFTIIVLPDTQLYAQRYPDLFLQQTKWIREQKDALNIAGVIHEGDITNLNSEEEWKVADRAMGTLDGVVPYLMVLGNHDLPGGGKTRDAALFNKYFGPRRFQGKPWYGGRYAEGNENAYYYLEAGGSKFLVVCLEFGPRDEVLEWANKIVAQHPDRRTILVTHSYMNFDDTRVGEGDRHNPHVYKVGGNDGEEMWEKLVRRHPNIFLVLSGHILDDGAGRLESVGDHGNTVHQVLANYQKREMGGNGRLRIMRFLPAENRIEVSTFSPALNAYETDDQNQFSLEYGTQDIF